MKRYIGPAILVLISAILLIIHTLNTRKENYPELIFSNEAIQFDNSFTSFVTTIESNIEDINTTFADTNKLKEFDFSENYFLQFAKNNPYIISVIFVQNNNKIAVKKIENSYIIAIDSTATTDVVKWKRFKNNKQISSWDESFSGSIKQTDWFKNLNNNPNKISWHFNIKPNIDNKNSTDTDNELFYAAYPMANEKSKSLIMFRFSRLSLLKAFSSYSKYDNINLLIQTADGDNFNLSSGINETFEDISSNTNPSDSFRIATLEHYNKFSNLDSGIFSFIYNNDIIWNSVKKIKKVGINFYILSIKNKDIIKLNKSSDSNNIFLWLAIIFVTIALIYSLILLFVNKKSKPANLDRCIDILKNDESRTLEFKSSLRWDYRQEKVNPELEKVIFKTIAAFGNTDGGILLIGVDDDKNILGLENDFKTLKKPNSDFFEIHLRNLLHTQMGVKYVSKNIRMQFEEVEKDIIVCKIKVMPADEALFLKMKDKNGQLTEKFYVRSGNSSQEIKSMSDINDYINTRFNKNKQ